MATEKLTRLKHLTQGINRCYSAALSKISELASVVEGKQDVLTGATNQTVGFDAQGAAVAEDKTHWAEEPVTVENEVTLDETTYEFADGVCQAAATLNFVDGAECTVTWDGVEYVTTCEYVLLDMAYYTMGNPAILGVEENAEDNGQPFGFAYAPDMGMVVMMSSDAEATSHTVAITSTYTTQEFHTLDNRYINAEWMAEPPTYKTVLTVEETTVTGEAEGDVYVAVVEADVSGIVAGSIVNLVLDGVEYTERYNGEYFGNVMIMYGAYAGGCPCVGVVYDAGIIFYLVTEGDHTIALSVDAPVYKQLPAEYLPDGIEAASAETAEKLTTSAGDSNTPVYFSNGVPKACTSLDLNTTGSAATCTGNSATATKLLNARTIQTNLGSTSSASFNGTANVTPGVTGVLPVANGGTGNSSVDTTPTSGSTKMVTSGGTADYVDEAMNMLGSGLYASQAGAAKWDGVIGDRAYVDFGDMQYYVQISDEVPTVLADLPYGQITVSVMMQGDVAMSYGGAGAITALSEDGLYQIGEYVFIIPSDGYVLESFTFPKKGVYVFAYNALASGFDVSLQYISSLRIAGYSFAESGGSDASEYFETVTETEVTELGDTLTWDGTISDSSVSFSPVSGYTLYCDKVSNNIPLLAELSGKTLECVLYNVETGESTVYTSNGDDVISEKTDGDAVELVDDMVWLIPTDGYELEGLLFPEKGIYFRKASYTDTDFVSSFTIPGYNFVVTETTESEIIKTEHLPEALRFGGETSPFGSAVGDGDTITWDGNTDGMETVDMSATAGWASGSAVCVLASKCAPTREELAAGATGTLSDGTEFSYASEETSTSKEYITKFSDCVWVIHDAEAFNAFYASGGFDFSFQNGVYFVAGSVATAYTASFTVPGCDFTTETEVVKIDEKYLPDTVVQNGDTELVLTSPGGTKFSITVSDDGTLTATEVTE